MKTDLIVIFKAAKDFIMKRLFYSAFFLVLFAITGPSVYGTHIMGGEMTYQYISGDSFLVTLILYRDCSPGAATLGTTASLSVKSIGCMNTSVTANLVSGSGNDITPVCSSISSPCNSSQSGLPLGIEQYVYTTIVVIPCNKFEISWTSCCRNSDITNGLHDASFYIYVSNDSPGMAVVGPNSSPEFSSPAAIFAPVSQPASFDFSATDLDGDSLVYRLGHPVGTGPNDPIPYAPGYNPLSAPVFLDSVTGILTTQVNTQEIDVIRIDVDEYRRTTSGWQHIGSIFRDIQLIFWDSLNQPPIITGIDSSGPDTWYATAGDSISFLIGAFDFNGSWANSDSVELRVVSTPPGSQFNPHPPAPFFLQYGDFTWNTDTSDISASPYILILEARDNACPVNGISYKAFKIFVSNPDTTEVWPGDANNDLIANHYDILPIGVAYGASGPQRANGSTNWVGQPAQHWPGSFPTGLNYKFADCNGDGTIDTVDVDVVNQNFGMTHNRYNPYARQPASADLWVELDQDTVRPGDQVTGQVLFGDVQNQLTAYGVAFSLIIDPAIIDATSMDLQFQPNWMVTQGLEFQKQDGNGTVYAANVRTDGQDAQGGGAIADLSFTVRSDANFTPGTLLPLSFADVLSIDAGMTSLNVTSGVEEAVLDKTVGIADPAFSFDIGPNPADEQIQIFSSVHLEEIEVVNKLGQRVEVPIEQDGNRILLDTRGLTPGYYLISVKAGDAIQTKSVVIQR